MDTKYELYLNIGFGIYGQFRCLELWPVSTSDKGANPDRLPKVTMTAREL